MRQNMLDDVWWRLYSCWISLQCLELIKYNAVDWSFFLNYESNIFWLTFLMHQEHRSGNRIVAVGIVSNHEVSRETLRDYCGRSLLERRGGIQGETETATGRPAPTPTSPLLPPSAAPCNIHLQPTGRIHPRGDFTFFSSQSALPPHHLVSARTDRSVSVKPSWRSKSDLRGVS